MCYCNDTPSHTRFGPRLFDNLRGSTMQGSYVALYSSTDREQFEWVV